eukprot:scaffold4.g4975.t1
MVPDPLPPTRPAGSPEGYEKPDLVDKYLASEMLPRRERTRVWLQQVTRDFERFPGDVGSTEVQVARLTEKIKALAEHMKVHRKDYSSRRGLEAMLTQRRQLLQYLRRTKFDTYAALISRLGLKDNYAETDRFSARYRAAAPAAAAAGNSEDRRWRGEPDDGGGEVRAEGRLLISSASPGLASGRGGSIWGHARLGAETVCQLIAQQLQQQQQPCALGPSCTPQSGNNVVGSWCAWQWDAAWEVRSDPVPCRLHEVAAFQPPNSKRQGATDIVCALEFEQQGWLFATAGVGKQVRVFSLAAALKEPSDQRWQRPLREHRLPAKLSSLAWEDHVQGVVTVGDYDGGVTHLDVEHGHVIAEGDGHGGRRVWSLSPHNDNLLAMASSNSRAYLYDLRMAAQPLAVLEGHSRALSYVRWMGAGRLVTASVDASLVAWDLSLLGLVGSAAPAAGAAAGADATAAAASGGSASLTAAAARTPAVLRPARRCRGHPNSKNYVGLAVHTEGNLVACGSEAAACFCYTPCWGTPLAKREFDFAPPPQLGGSLSGASSNGASGTGRFCSAVAWQPAAAVPGGPPFLAAALSDGNVHMLALQQQLLRA